MFFVLDQMLIDIEYFYSFFKIKWRPVLWGLCLQLVLGIMVLRWKPGYDAVKFISEQLNKFLMYSLEGAAVVFGDPTLFLHPFIGIVSFHNSNLRVDKWQIKRNRGLSTDRIFLILMRNPNLNTLRIWTLLGTS